MTQVIDPWPDCPDNPVCSKCLTTDRRYKYYRNITGVSCQGCVDDKTLSYAMPIGYPDTAMRYGLLVDPIGPWDAMIRGLAGIDNLTESETLLVLGYNCGYVPAQHVEPYKKALAELDRRLKMKADEEFAKAQREATAKGSWVGTVGPAQDLPDLLCERIVPLGVTQYGSRYLILFRTEAGNKVVWFTGEGTKFDPQPGNTYKVRASVKEHSVYADEKQTVITRVKERITK